MGHGALSMSKGITDHLCLIKAGEHVWLATMEIRKTHQEKGQDRSKECPYLPSCDSTYELSLGDLEV